MDLPAPVFELKHVSQQFGQFSALTDISLQIYPGERVALVGSSGAGKSTLLQLLNGTLRSTQGEVWAMGRNLSQLSSKRLRQIQQQIGTIYQQLHLVDNLRVIHNVNAGQLGRWSFLKALTSLIVPLETETAIKALSQVGIAEKVYERTDRLSGGQQQRVAIARVLVQNPIVILADEPIASLDPELSREVMDLLRNLAQQTHRTLIVSLHDVDFARSHCDRIIGLRQGKVLFDAAPHQVSPDLIADLYRLESHR
ncbi:phosphonate ABC transporter ATP-binding protein [Phormidesmis priestleyi]|uniref:phosphonate ABC transporter ATP-binding protein n=1 Tax=Phormidesmis priestleyi TaxID=268141 RepID=UPI00083A9895|nr:phosphonate ABC transporter ATP-binding protein [Phormidesmis priestleyi]